MLSIVCWRSFWVPLANEHHLPGEIDELAIFMIFLGIHELLMVDGELVRDDVLEHLREPEWLNRHLEVEALDGLLDDDDSILLIEHPLESQLLPDVEEQLHAVLL